MASDSYDLDDQDQSELFDEDNLDDEPGGVARNEFKTFEEAPDVLDVTRRLGDAQDDAAIDEADFDPDAIDDGDTEDTGELFASDAYDESATNLDDTDLTDGVEATSADEVELVYAADVDGRRSAQGSAAHFESRGELGTDDLEELGYRNRKSGK